jgi:cellulose synthase (UDP-forming)
VPRVLRALLIGLVAVLGYAAAGLAGLVPWRATPGATVASGAWLMIAATTVGLGMRRIRAAEFASSRRNAHRFAVQATVVVDGVETDLVDISVGGALVRMPALETLGPGLVQLVLPGADPVKVFPVRATDVTESGERFASLQVLPTDWAAMRTLSLWIFHTPAGAVANLPDGVPAAACTAPAPSLSVRKSRAASALVRSTVAVSRG